MRGAWRQVFLSDSRKSLRARGECCAQRELFRHGDRPSRIYIDFPKLAERLFVLHLVGRFGRAIPPYPP